MKMVCGAYTSYICMCLAFEILTCVQMSVISHVQLRIFFQMWKIYMYVRG